VPETPLLHFPVKSLAGVRACSGVISAANSNITNRIGVIILNGVMALLLNPKR